MSRKISGVLFSVVALAMCGTASAATPGWYLGVGAGESDADVSSGDVNQDMAEAGITGTSSVDDTDTAWKIFAGYQYNRYLGVEVGYVDLGEIDVDAITTAPTAATIKADVETQGVALSVVGSYPINDKFSVFGRVGAFYWDTEASAAAVVSGAVAKASEDDDGIDLLFGAGAEYGFTRNIGVRLEWERYDVDGDDVDMISGNLLYRF